MYISWYVALILLVYLSGDALRYLAVCGSPEGVSLVRLQTPPYWPTAVQLSRDLVKCTGTNSGYPLSTADCALYIF